MREEKQSLELVHIKKIEQIVCKCVNRMFELLKTTSFKPIDCNDIYLGKTNVPLQRRLLRSAVFVVAHDRFGLSYNVLSRYSGISSRNIKRQVTIYRETITTDKYIQMTNELIDEELTKFPI